MSKKRLFSEKAPSARKKRTTATAGLFSAVARLDSDDVRAARIRKTHTASSISKSKAARDQADLQGDLIECRILLQRALGQLPSIAGNGSRKRRLTKEVDGTSSSEDDKDDDSKETSSYATAADSLLKNLLEARKKLCLRSKSYGGESSSGATDAAIVGDGPKESFTLQSEYDSCRSRWRDVLDHRHHDLRLHSGLSAKGGSKFRVMDQSFWDQVESTASHERLVRMQQTHTSGGDEDGDGGIDDAGEVTSSMMFDDSKVYQHMLKDFIASGSSRKSGGGSGGAAEDAAERLRRAMRKKGATKKDVDRRASKGRKIRYAVHPKLANFTFPIARPAPAIDEDDWFRSLFGGKGAGSFAGAR